MCLPDLNISTYLKLLLNLNTNCFQLFPLLQQGIDPWCPPVSRSLPPWRRVPNCPEGTKRLVLLEPRQHHSVWDWVKLHPFCVIPMEFGLQTCDFPSCFLNCLWFINGLVEHLITGKPWSFSPWSSWENPAVSEAKHPRSSAPGSRWCFPGTPGKKKQLPSDKFWQILKEKNPGKHVNKHCCFCCCWRSCGRGGGGCGASIPIDVKLWSLWMKIPDAEWLCNSH